MNDYGQFVLFCIRIGRMKFCHSQVFPQIYSNLLSCPIELGTASLEAASKYSQQESGLLMSTSVFLEFTFCYNL